MYSQEVTILNETGLHARPASDFVREAKKFNSKIRIKPTALPEESANAKSIVSVLALGVPQGTRIELSADGDDEREAVNTLVDLINTGFGE